MANKKKDIPPEIMKEYAKLLSCVMPEGWCFTLLVFEANKNPGKVNYISSAQRASMKESLRGVLQKWESEN